MRPALPWFALVAAACDGRGPEVAPAEPESCVREIRIGPREDLAARLDAAGPGDCIRLAAGFHRPRRTLALTRSGTAAQPIAILGDAGSVVDGRDLGAGPLLRIAADHIVVRGVDLRRAPGNTGDHTVEIDGEDLGHGRGVTVTDCAITGGHDSLKVRGMATGVTIAGNELRGGFRHIAVSITGATDLVLRDNTIGGWDLGENGSVQVKGGSSRVRIEGNRFHDIAGFGAALALGDGCGPTCDHDPEHYAARDLVAIHNRFERVQRAIDVLGCSGCQVVHEVLVDSGRDTAAIKIGPAVTHGHRRDARDTLLLGNVIVDRDGDMLALLDVLGPARDSLRLVGNVVVGDRSLLGLGPTLDAAPSAGFTVVAADVD